jgi:transcriptional regulator with XRE-family HTH domain
MGDRLRVWLTEELNRRGLSHNELARRSGISQTAVSYVISGDRKAGAEFCIKIATALDVSPEFVLRLAEILPPSSSLEDSTAEEINEALKNLSADQRQQVLDYIRFLSQQRKT